ncbi:MAG: D-alanyl-D-alanine carboxypeptidase/D-alanyl-D-alanine-endopeptidase [Agriterribacter sp.]
MKRNENNKIILSTAAVRSGILLIVLLCGVYTNAQTINQKIKTAFQYFENDNQLKHAISSLYVIDANTGEVLFDKNSQIGLTPASTQKVITTVTAYELLGNDFRYNTSFAIDTILHTVYILPSGDPTFGSTRWEQTKPNAIMKRVVNAIPLKKTHDYTIVVDKSKWETNEIPDGWIWQDMANYYGAGAGKLIWRENQFDVLLQSGPKLGDTVKVTGTNPSLFGKYTLKNMVTAAVSGSGDNAYFYFPLRSSEGIIKGTIPVNQNRFTVSGSLPSGSDQFINELSDTLVKLQLMQSSAINQSIVLADNEQKRLNIFHTETSPPLDSIIYWFNKKSINLYGEALVKTIALKKNGYASTDTGTALIQKFWKEKGIDPSELNIVDGSGLSPLNRVTTHAQVEVLKYAKTKSWFKSFYNALPIYNNISMKSGTIRNTKGFCGYYTAANGNSYIFSFLVNNYTGSTNAIVRKMYLVLDVLK